MKKVFVFVLSVISFNAFSQSATGKIVLKKGQHFIIESKSDGSVTQEMLGQKMDISINNATTLTADIKDFSNNNYTITQTLTKVKITFTGAGQDKTFDSDKKDTANSAETELYKDELNVPKDIVITNEGKNTAAGDTSKKTDDGGTDPMQAMMGMMGGGKVNAGTALFLVIPAGKKAGDTWQDSTTDEGIKLKKVYTINSIANKEAKVTVNGIMDINKTVQMQGVDMSAVMTSKVTSNILVDLVSNIQKENTSTNDVSGTIELMGQSVPITSKITTVTTVKSL